MGPAFYTAGFGHRQLGLSDAESRMLSSFPPAGIYVSFELGF